MDARGQSGSGSPGVSVRGQWWQDVTLGSSGQGLRSHGGREGGDRSRTPWTSPAPRPHHETGHWGACAAVAPGSEDSAWPAALCPLPSGLGLGPRRPGGRFGHSLSHGVIPISSSVTQGCSAYPRLHSGPRGLCHEGCAAGLGWGGLLSGRGRGPGPLSLRTPPAGRFHEWPEAM